MPAVHPTAINDQHHAIRGEMKSRHPDDPKDHILRRGVIQSTPQECLYQLLSRQGINRAEIKAWNCPVLRDVQFVFPYDSRTNCPWFCVCMSALVHDSPGFQAAFLNLSFIIFSTVFFDRKHIHLSTMLQL